MAQAISSTPYLASPEDYVALMKPRVMSLVIFTAVIGVLLSPMTTHPVLMIISVLAIAAGAGASGAINQWYDRDIDAQMERTANRPIPLGRVHPDEALSLGLIISVLSVLVLGFAGGFKAAAMLAFTIVFLWADLYGLVKTKYNPEHCHRRCRRGISPGDWLASGWW
jgi:protoheme IX farnesyltransferase